MNKDLFKVCAKLEYELNALGVSKQTIKAYVFHNRKFLEIIKKEPKKITSRDLKDYIIYMKNKGYMPATINLAISSIKFYYMNLMRKTRFSRLKAVKKEQKLPTVLTKDEIKRMIDKTSNIRHKLLIEFLYATGVRAGELVRFKFDDIFVEEKLGIVRLGKGRKDRYVKLSDLLIKDLLYYKKYRKDSNPFIFNKANTHITIRAVEEIVKSAAKRAEIKKRVYPHALRASCATHLFDDGARTEDIQVLLGHSQIRTTRGYINKRPKQVSIIKSPLDRL